MKNAEKLALHGGSPVREKLLPYGRQSIDENDIRSVVDVLRSDWITTGPKVEEFEAAFAEIAGARHGVCFSSGTAALHGAAFAAQLGPGDEAVTTPMSFCATANCVLYMGARPVFADVCPDTLNIDPERVVARLSDRTRAIIAVDYAGHPADLGPLRDIARDKELVFIEDACHAPGAEYRGRRVGALADMTVFSFHPVKHITTAEGGMVTTDDEDLAARLRLLRSHGIGSHPRQRQEKGRWFYSMDALGYNYRLSDMACALGLSQLRKLEPNLARRREIAAAYDEAFGRLSTIERPAVRDDVVPAWHLYPIRLQLDALKADRAEIFQALVAEGLGVNVHYIPIHLHPFYRDQMGCRPRTLPIAEAAYERLVSLPMFHAMTDRDVADVIEAVGKVLTYYSS